MPKNLSHLANIALTVVLMYDHRVARKNKAIYEELLGDYNRQCDSLTLSRVQAGFLLDIINRNKMPLNEFDKIALHNLDFKVGE